MIGGKCFSQPPYTNDKLMLKGTVRGRYFLPKAKNSFFSSKIHKNYGFIVKIIKVNNISLK